MIFRDYLDLVDVVQLREVCKRFKFLVDHLGPTELLVSHHLPPSEVIDGKDPDQFIQLNHFDLEPNTQQLIGFKTVFANLRFLRLNVSHDLKKNSFNIEVLNELTKLERLYLPLRWIAREQVLKLPRLKVLSIYLRLEKEYYMRPYEIKRINFDLEPHLVVDSKVEKLICDNLNIIRLNHPECIEFLECDILKKEDLVSFKKLRVLRTFISSTILDNFQALEHLEAIHLIWNHEQVIALMKSLRLGDYWDEVERMLSQLIGRSSEMKKPIKVYFLDVPLTGSHGMPFPGLRDLTLHPFRSYRLPAIRICNYNLIERVTCVQTVDYCRLIGWLDEERENLLRNQVTLNDWQFPVDFFAKFSEIRCVEVNQSPDNEERLVFFLQNCPQIVRLSMEFLSQLVLDRLPVACKLLKNLLMCGRDDRNAPLDFSPIYKLKKLLHLQILGRLVNPPSVIRLLEECRHLTKIDSFMKVRKSCGLRPRFHLNFRQENNLVKSHSNLTFEELKAILINIET